jgi:hypothetical protein
LNVNVSKVGKGFVPGLLGVLKAEPNRERLGEDGVGV